MNPPSLSFPPNNPNPPPPPRSPPQALFLGLAGRKDHPVLPDDDGTSVGLSPSHERGERDGERRRPEVPRYDANRAPSPVPRLPRPRTREAPAERPRSPPKRGEEEKEASEREKASERGDQRRARDGVDLREGIKASLWRAPCRCAPARARPQVTEVVLSVC